jgi:hypothetical protein
VENFQNQLSVIEILEVAKAVAEMFQGKMRIAHVDKHMTDLELNKFGEVVASNRGLVVRVFNNLEKAKEWIET